LKYHIPCRVIDILLKKGRTYHHTDDYIFFKNNVPGIGSLARI